jgi:uncharacterized protein YprB with RNaseH-like and TPR domain
MVVCFDIETAGHGIDPQKSTVSLIGMKRNRKILQWKIWEVGDEAEMILQAFKEIESTNKFEETILGFNNLKFDVPFLLKRLEILGRMKPELWIMIHDKKWFDLYQFLGNSYQSQKLWLERLGIEREFPDLDGRDMPRYYETKEYEKIAKHNRDDLNTSEALFRKLKTVGISMKDLLGFD